MNLSLNEFLGQIISADLTMNEMSVLLELGYKEATREELLSSSAGRSGLTSGIYSPPVLTRTIQKLTEKNLVALKYKTYCLADKCNSYGGYEKILLAVARSKVMTLNTMKIAIQLVIEDNVPSSARYIGNKLDLTADYLVSSPLLRMYVIGLLKKQLITDCKAKNVLDSELPLEPKRLAFFLDLKWQGYVDEEWM